jgi:signal peptidase II
VSGSLRRLDLWAAVAIVAADQATKALVVRAIALHDTVTVVPGLLNLTYVQNTGAAFGFMNAFQFPFKAAVVAGLAVFALVAIAYYAHRFGSSTLIGRAAMALILGGAVGNLIDRATRGFVVDFVDAHWGGWHFWAFNVADAAITVGAILLILDMLGAGRDVPQAV